MTYDLPSEPAPRKVTIVGDSVVAVATSPFNFRQQVHAWPGQRWQITLEMPPMPPTQAGAWLALFSACNGRQHTFRWRPGGLHRTARAEPAGAPVADGAGAGRTIKTRGWLPLAAKAVEAGCLIEVQGRLRRVLADVNADGDGKAELSVWPDVAAIADGDVINVASPSGRFRFIDSPTVAYAEDRHLAPVTIAAEEEL